MPEVETTNVGTPSEPSSLGGGEGGLQLSDEDILGIEPEGAPSTATEPAAPVPETPEPEPAAAPAPKKEEPQAAPEVEEVDDLKWMRPLLNDKVFGPKLQSMHDRLLAFQELYPKVADARAIKELVPGGIEELKALMAVKNDTDQLDLQYYSHDPEEQKELANNLLRDDPEAFNGMVQAGLDLIKGQSPQQWAYLTQHIVGDSLGNEKVWDWLEYIHEAATKEGASNVAQLLNQFAGVFQKYGLGPKEHEDPNLQRVNAARSEVEKKYADLQAERTRDFSAQVHESVHKSLDAEVTGQLAKLLPRISEGLRGKIAGDIHAAIQNVVNTDARLKLNIQNLTRTGGINRQTLAQVVNLLTSKAKAVMPGAVKRVVNDYTASIMSSRKEVTDKQNAAASRVDVSAGARAGSGIKPLTREEARNMTPEEILNSNRPVAHR